METERYTETLSRTRVTIRTLWKQYSLSAAEAGKAKIKRSKTVFVQVLGTICSYGCYVVLAREQRPSGIPGYKVRRFAAANVIIIIIIYSTHIKKILVFYRFV